MNPEVWGAKPHDLIAISAYHLGLKEDSIIHGKIAVDLEPDNVRLINNLEYYKA
jgi:hypothetical protein